MKHKLYLPLLICFFGLSSLLAQDALIEALDKSYSKYELSNIDSDLLYNQLNDRNAFHHISLTIGGNEYEIELWDSGLLSPDFKVTLASGAEHQAAPPLAMRGQIVGDNSSKVSLTINDGFIYGFINHKGKILNIEPASNHHKSAGPDIFVSYYDDNLKSQDAHSCGTSHSRLKNQIKNNVQQQRSVGECYEDVGTSYDDEFADEIFFDLNDVWLSDCSTCDPWTSSTDAGALLDDFTDWAPNNLSGHVVATLWTDRNLAGSTIGIAWLGTACTNFGYNVCQDINGSSLLRVLQSHELGHNFDATHDSGGGFIMSPSVSGSTSWSTQSEDDILDFFASANNCWTSCGSSGFPPVADFEFEVIDNCTPGEVEFFDESLDADSWFWTFDGGIPETSTDQNPVVFYDFPGAFNVSLEVSNNFGSDTKNENHIIEIFEPPIASFDYELDELEVFFENISAGTDLVYIWDFGDGVISFQEEPEHIYAAPGTYVVELDIENECDFDVVEEIIVIYDQPDAMFTSDFDTGCAFDEVQFSDVSYGNIVSRSWSFPGGTPASSTDPNPSVAYNAPGVYDVILQVTNPEGTSSITETSYVTIFDPPVAGFSHTESNTTVTFANSSTSATSNVWNFGDGQSSTDANPVHVYAAPGFYDVTLDVDNECGSDALTQSIAVYDQPNAMFSSNGQTGCTNTEFQFSDLSYGNIVSRIWNFPGGNPSTSTDINPIVQYAVPGSYEVTLQVVNPSGESTLSQAEYISISPNATAGFSFTSDNNSVNFNNSSINATDYFWDFGDGFSSIEENPIHDYASSGTYTVILTSSNICGSTTETQTLTTSLDPVAQFSTSQGASGCAGYTVDFLDSSAGSPTSWNWSFPGGNPTSSNLQNPSVTYASPGTYDVTLAITNILGTDSQTLSDYVTILGDPTATYLSNVNGNRLDLSNTTPGSSATWEISDGATLNGNNVAHILGANGTYQVRLEVMDDCGTDVKDFTIEIDAYPTSTFTRSNTLDTDCVPAIVEFNSTSDQATNYLWQFPGGTPSSSTEANPVITYNSVGTFDVSLEVANQYGTDASSQVGFIKVEDAPIVDFISLADGPVINFTNTSSNATTFNWDFGDGNMSILENPEHNYDQPGSYTVRFTASNDCGSSVMDRVVIFDYALPIINASFSATTGCAPMEVAITDETTNNPTSWSWQMPGGIPETSTDQNPIVSYNVPGTYSISAEVTNSDGTASMEFTDIVVVYDLPISDFEISSIGETISATNNSTGATSYLWDFGDGQTSTDFEPEHIYDEPGIYDVSLIVSNDCGAVETLQTITIMTSSISDIQVFGQWTVSPNPTRGEINISFEDRLTQNLNYELKDINGRTIEEGIFDVGAQYETLSISESGLFLMILTKDDKISIEKITVID